MKIFRFVSTVLIVFHLTVASLDPTPLLILKSGRSGSSWFTSLLNRRVGVYLTEEIFHMPNESTAITTAYLTEAIRHPMQKWPLGPSKIVGNDWVILGATLESTEFSHVSFVDLPEMVPDLRVVAYIRSNKVKHVISTIRAKLLLEKCHKAVVSTHKSCSLTEKTTVDVQFFDDILIKKLAEDKIILDQALGLVANLRTQFYFLSYEELVGDLEEIDRLLLWISVNPEDLLAMSSSYTGRCKYNCTKTTPDDLRDVVENYEELESWIRTNYPCLLSQFYETRAGKFQPDVRILCGDKFTDEINKRVAKGFDVPLV